MGARALGPWQGFMFARGARIHPSGYAFPEVGFAVALSGALRPCIRQLPSAVALLPRRPSAACFCTGVVGLRDCKPAPVFTADVAPPVHHRRV